MSSSLPINLNDLLYQRGVEAPRIEFMTAKVPFDDRPARDFTLNDLRVSLVREFLRELQSGLVDEKDEAEIYRRMRISQRINEHEVPRNVALLFFSDDPERAFRGARIEVVHFTDGGDVLEEHVFRGPLLRQLRDCLSYLQGRVALHVRKVPEQPESDSWVSYPFSALEEAVVNAVYHRSYESDVPEPTKIYVYADRIEVTSYPGPARGLLPEHFLRRHELPPVTARNRRIGELLKEIKMAEARGTGIEKIYRAMEQNGSPVPQFRFGEERGYFTAVLPVRPPTLSEAVESHGSVGGAMDAGQAGREGLILIAVGAESIRPGVEESQEALGLTQARMLVDYSLPDYVEAQTAQWETTAREIRNRVRQAAEDPAIGRLHLFYRGPVAFAPLLGALIASSSKPLSVYHYQDGRYTPAYTMDRRFLIAKD